MASMTAAAVTSPCLARRVRGSASRASPTAHICVVPRTAIVRKSSVRLPLRNARSIAAGSMYGNCWGPAVVGCGPSYGGWNRGQGGQRSFEKWAEQASNNMWFPVDVEETNEDYTFVADVPGLGKNDIKVQVNKERVLSISGQRQQRSASSTKSSSNVDVEDSSTSKSDTTDNKVQRRRQERRFGTFKRTWNLPEDADVSQIKASVEQGVLTLKINRIQPAEPEVTDIPIN